MFSSARFHLTMLYVFIILMITGAISFLFYIQTSLVIENRFRQIELRWQKEYFPQYNIQNYSYQPPIFFAKDISDAKRAIILQLLLVNGCIAAMVGILGYYLSGRTLSPIKDVYQAQKQFIADAAHELKTPITALKTSLEVNMMDPHLSELTKRILKENFEDVLNLETLTNNLLKLARFEQSKVEFTAVSIKEILEQAIKMVKPLAKKKKITINIVKQEKDTTVEGDKTGLTEVLVILLDNAVKYSPAETTIDVAIRKTRGNFFILVQDHGVGIPKQHLPHIFDRFYRIDTSRSKVNAVGHGLGLSIAQKIMKEHHGSLTVKSVIDQGSTFIMQLPA